MIEIWCETWGCWRHDRKSCITKLTYWTSLRNKVFQFLVATEQVYRSLCLYVCLSICLSVCLSVTSYFSGLLGATMSRTYNLVVLTNSFCKYGKTSLFERYSWQLDFKIAFFLWEKSYCRHIFWQIFFSNFIFDTYCLDDKKETFCRGVLSWKWISCKMTIPKRQPAAAFIIIRIVWFFRLPIDAFRGNGWASKRCAENGLT